MRKDIYKSKRTKRTEITSWALIVVVVLALLSPFIYRKVLVRDSVTEYKELLVITMSDGTLWEVLTALYFRWTCLPDCAVPELDADYRRNNRRLS